MQTGSVLTLNFYSNPIDVMIGDDQTIYLNWKHFCDIIDRDPEVAPHNIIRGEFDVDYIAFTYVVGHLTELVEGCDVLNTWLILNEFPNYIIRELGIVRELIPLIEVSHATYDSGVLTHNGETFVLTNKMRKFTGIHEPVIPADVPRFPIVVCIKTSRIKNPLDAFCGKAEEVLDIMPSWMVEVSSIPYIVESSSAPTVMTNDKPYRLSLKLPMDSDLGKKIRELDPKQRFDSPGVVGTHSCQIVANTKTNMIEVHEDQRVDIGRALFGEDEAMTWAGSGLQCKPEL